MLIPISRGSRQIVMVGDQCQLPATVISKEAQQKGLDVSLFERMLTLGMEVCWRCPLKNESWCQIFAGDSRLSA